MTTWTIAFQAPVHQEYANILITNTLNKMILQMKKEKKKDKEELNNNKDNTNKYIVNSGLDITIMWITS